MYVRMDVLMYVTYVCMYVYMYICTCTGVHACMFVRNYVRKQIDRRAYRQPGRQAGRQARRRREQAGRQTCMCILLRAHVNTRTHDRFSRSHHFRVHLGAGAREGHHAARRLNRGSIRGSCEERLPGYQVKQTFRTPVSLKRLRVS